MYNHNQLKVHLHNRFYCRENYADNFETYVIDKSDLEEIKNVSNSIILPPEEARNRFVEASFLEQWAEIHKPWTQPFTARKTAGNDFIKTFHKRGEKNVLFVKDARIIINNVNPNNFANHR